jgi:hypothetical protein
MKIYGIFEVCDDASMPQSWNIVDPPQEEWNSGMLECWNSGFFKGYFKHSIFDSYKIARIYLTLRKFFIVGWAVPTKLR